ncbi:MAG: hypothetical protein N4A57_10675 [Anaeromicrobium sp.]|jgi:hypothetical protein|uniref:hypothetical protein n=1 Tax=Anaeromicrobium sp. TaxID=1929132 RepID=UPI0025D18B19|nr:hypothetical protein [Anaeromicrobium sp.]MCT4594715.1 hypothetical protein [Anaeromicrobium sp.]
MKRNHINKDKEIKVIKNSVDSGAVEDIYELKTQELSIKSARVTEEMNQINTAWATGSAPRERK